MTVRKIMILLYGAGGVPGRGEIPMIQISNLFLIKTGLSLLRQLKGGSSKDGEKKGEVAGMNLSSVKINKNLIDTAKSFTLKRLFMMAGKTFTKEMILDINADLNKIKKKAK